MSVTLSLLVLRAQNPEATRDFYAALGLDFQPEQHGSGPLHYAAEIGGMVIEIYPLKAEQTEADASTMLGFQVESLEDALRDLKAEADIKSSQWGRFCSIKDPDGRSVRLSEVSSAE